MAALNESTVAELLRRAGFAEAEVPLMVNIAKRESGLRPGAHNPNRATGDNSYGLFQINMIDKLGPERLQQFAPFGVSRFEDLKDPWKNVQAAKLVRDRQGLGAWTTLAAAKSDAAPALGGPSQAADLLAGSTPGDASGGMGAGLLEGLLAPPELGAPQPRGLGLVEAGRNPLAAAALAQVAAAAGGPRLAGSAGFVAQLEAMQSLAGRPQASPAAGAPVSVPAALPAVQAASGGEGPELDIVQIGKALQGKGFKVAEHPAFGGVGQHSPRSHHYAGQALDLTIQPGSPLLTGKDDSAWKDLTRQYGAQLKALIPGAEIFHPGDDPVGGHDSHIHLALPGGRTKASRELAALLRLNQG
jgi:hypothetical protein